MVSGTMGWNSTFWGRKRQSTRDLLSWGREEEEESCFFFPSPRSGA